MAAVAVNGPVPLACRVVVLMSTYQGERFVAAQLHSILDQLPPNGHILIRDDGSSDGTAARIEAITDSRLTLIRGDNLGFGHSFLTLLALVAADTEMVMFADQDDVWLPGKIARAWEHLVPFAQTPALYGSAQWLTDEALRPIQQTAPWPRGPSFAGALVENLITGCTAALNRPAVALLQRAGVPAAVRFHDWWLYLVISGVGTVVMDDEPTLLYRQHSGNHIGRGAGWLGRPVRMARFLFRNDWVGILLWQVTALRQCYGDSLNPASQGILQRYFCADGQRTLPSWRLIFGLRRWRQSLRDELPLRLLLAAYRVHLWPLPGRRLRVSGGAST